MESIITALKDTPIPTIMVVAGIVFLLLAVAGQLAGRIVVAPERQRWAAIIGGGLLVIGLALHIAPQLKERFPVTKGVSTSQPSTSKDSPVPLPPTPEKVSVPPGVQSYRLTTRLTRISDVQVIGRTGNVEFSVFVNDVQIGVYSSDDVDADISRFINPGSNTVRIVWTADPEMTSGYAAELRIEAKLGERWSPVITRRVTKTTKAGETTSSFTHR
jgi:hypothetical protein